MAAELGAEIEWTVGAESELLEALRRGELHVVACGLRRATPWESRVGLTQPYITIDDSEHVLAVPPGENRWLLELDKFLQSRAAHVPAWLESELAR